jgi:hypothetical protein
MGGGGGGGDDVSFVAFCKSRNTGDHSLRRMARFYEAMESFPKAGDCFNKDSLLVSYLMTTSYRLPLPCNVPIMHVDITMSSVDR